MAPGPGPGRPSDALGASRVSVFWRSAARRTQESAASAEAAAYSTSQSLLLPAYSPFRLTQAAATWQRRARDIEREAAGLASAQDVHVHAAAMHWILAVRGRMAAQDWRNVLRLAEMALQKAHKVEEANARLASSHFRSLMRADGRKPAPSKAAFRWVRGPSGWVDSAAAAEASSLEPSDQCVAFAEMAVLAGGNAIDAELAKAAPLAPMGEQAEVDAEADKWAECWQESLAYNIRWPAELGAPATLIKAEDLKDAAMSFAMTTGLGTDNVSPRAVARLSLDLLTRLAVILSLTESSGDWPEAIKLVLIVLLPKPDGGRRPIGLLPTLVRIWGRARRIVIRQWEADNSRADIYGGQGRGAQRAAWEAALGAEHAHMTGLAFIQTLMDMVKAFGTVPHQQLIESASERGFPLWLLRLSLAIYRMPRVIMIERRCSRLIVASRGITAGSTFATTELIALLIGLVDLLNGRWGGIVRLKLYVDDLSMAVAGARSRTTAIAAAATDMAVRFFEDKLFMKVSPTKTVVIGSRPCLAKRVARVVLRPRALAVKVGKLLGTAAAGGVRRATCIQRVRMAMFAKKAARIRALGRSAGVDARRLTSAIAAPTMMYGAACTGVADTVLDSMRSLAAHSAAAVGGGKNVDMVLLAADCDQGTMDPCFAAHTLPIGHWAKAVWEKWAPASQLAELLELAQRRRALQPKAMWSAATGPAAALLATLERLGWVARSATVMIDDQGRVHNLHLDPPAVIVEQVRASVRRWRLARVAHACLGLVPDQADFGVGFEGPVGMYPSGIAMLPRDAIDLTGQLRKLLSTKSDGSTIGLKDAPSAVMWMPAHRAALRSAATAGQWAQCRLKQAFQEVEDDRCQLCLAALGDLAHRYVCATTLPQEGWPIPPGPIAMALSRMAPSRRRWLTWRGLYVARVRVPPARADAHLEWIMPIPDAHHEGAKWIIDGSLLDGPRRLTRRPGFAMLMVSQYGTPLALGMGTPPEWVHTANGGEGWALLQVLLQSIGQETIFTDCRSLLDTLR